MLATFSYDWMDESYGYRLVSTGSLTAIINLLFLHYFFVQKIFLNSLFVYKPVRESYRRLSQIGLQKYIGLLLRRFHSPMFKKADRVFQKSYYSTDSFMIS